MLGNAARGTLADGRIIGRAKAVATTHRSSLVNSKIILSVKGPAAAVAAGNSDQARAIAPVTKGAATLVRSAFRGNLIRE
jgi:hypothetical protein